ncbi:hypothetical protein QNI19_21385 [Cytophagaceae bacterium DM2B3-1]|uniref:Beta-lactamase-inhibitor-like PepSY-like domain-containing protein n=1 Tax=Xanthocytophaga flava TaxID=3048013 RepID=A0ABT7CP77_9BACT|nr:hypothetical protein [Xanthocytophaga flavus]MDJ1466302.1 hypothetical protein [Xanthocytophaga flavus]MDJ1495507.1 hypothetical protein [Xanthocytophaga flavus]
MKTIVFASILLAISWVSLQAQVSLTTETITIKKVPSGETPTDEINAFLKDFPNEVITKNTLQPLDTYTKNWKVVDTRSSDYRAGQSADYYQVDTRSNHTVTHSIYSKDGRLLYFSEKTKNGELPAVITNTLEKDYKGWKIVSEKEMIHSSKKPDYYKVVIENGKYKRTLFFDLEGKFLKEHA